MSSQITDQDLKSYDINRISYKGKLALYAKSSGWALCIGAGISKPFFPDWNTLAKKLLMKIENPKIVEVDVNKMVNEFGAAPAIQAAAKFYNDPDTFPTCISEALYADFKKNTKKQGDEIWTNLISKALSGASPRALSRKNDWKLFIKCLCDMSQDSSCSSFGIAEAVANVVGTAAQPQAILSFNAEPLMFSLINAFYALSSKSKAYASENMRPLVRMLHDLSQRQSGQIPYFHIHGLVPIPNQSGSFGKSISNEKLIFTEEQYLSLSNLSYSWQGTNFLSICQNHRCVFAGVSFTDPNLRRWLAWQHKSRALERKSKKLPTERTQHYWFKKHNNAGNPQLNAEQQLLQASMDHLGVRIIWIKEYTEIGERLKEMLTPKMGNSSSNR